MLREDRYLVLKRKDLSKALDILDEKHSSYLISICEAVEKIRRLENRKPLRGVIIESDWPEYEKVWKMLEERVDAD